MNNSLFRSRSKRLGSVATRFYFISNLLYNSLQYSPFAKRPRVHLYVYRVVVLPFIDKVGGRI